MSTKSLTGAARIRASGASPGRTRRGFPREYYRNYDQLTTLAMMGAVTSALLLGTGICLVVQRGSVAWTGL